MHTHCIYNVHCEHVWCRAKMPLHYIVTAFLNNETEGERRKEKKKSTNSLGIFYGHFTSHTYDASTQFRSNTLRIIQWKFATMPLRKAKQWNLVLCPKIKRTIISSSWMPLPSTTKSNQINGIAQQNDQTFKWLKTKEICSRLKGEWNRIQWLKWKEPAVQWIHRYK